MSERRAQVDAPGLTLVLLCVVIWGVNQVAAKLALAEIAPLMQAAARSAGAAVLLALWARRRGIGMSVGDGTLLPGIVAGLLFAAEFGCIFVGLQHTAASRMVVFIYLAPFVVALGMPFIVASERLDALQSLGLLLAFGGVAFAFAEGFTQPAHGPLQWLGDALGMAGAVLWGATTLVLRATSLARASPEKSLQYQLVVSAVALALASWAAGEAWPTKLTAASLAPLAFQIVIVTFASYLAWFWLIRHYPATLISAFTLLAPVFGLVAGALILGEPITPRIVVALAAVAAGVALVNRLWRRSA
jgi:drug/metabolite transporter (DMT)-like permease